MEIPKDSRTYTHQLGESRDFKPILTKIFNEQVLPELANIIENLTKSGGPKKIILNIDFKEANEYNEKNRGQQYILRGEHMEWLAQKVQGEVNKRAGSEILVDYEVRGHNAPGKVRMGTTFDNHGTLTFSCLSHDDYDFDF